MPSSAQTTEKGISLTYELPSAENTSLVTQTEAPDLANSLQLLPSSLDVAPVRLESLCDRMGDFTNIHLPSLTPVKNEKGDFQTMVTVVTGESQEALFSQLQSAESYPGYDRQVTEAPSDIFSGEQLMSSSPVLDAIRGLSPVQLSDIPLHMLATPSPLETRPPSPILVPNITMALESSHDIVDADIINAISPSFDLPLYSASHPSLPASDWSKMIGESGGGLANQIATSDSSLGLDQSWSSASEDGQALPLFEPTLDFDSLMDYD